MFYFRAETKAEFVRFVKLRMVWKKPELLDKSKVPFLCFYPVTETSFHNQDTESNVKFASGKVVFSCKTFCNLCFIYNFIEKSCVTLYLSGHAAKSLIAQTGHHFCNRTIHHQTTVCQVWPPLGALKQKGSMQLNNYLSSDSIITDRGPWGHSGYHEGGCQAAQLSPSDIIHLCVPTRSSLGRSK